MFPNSFLLDSKGAMLEKRPRQVSLYQQMFLKTLVSGQINKGLEVLLEPLKQCAPRQSISQAKQKLLS